MTSTVAIEVGAEIITRRIIHSCSLMEWFAHSQDFESQVRVKTIRPSIAGLKGEAFASTKQIGQGTGTEQQNTQCPSQVHICVYMLGKYF